LYRFTQIRPHKKSSEIRSERVKQTNNSLQEFYDFLNSTKNAWI